MQLGNGMTVLESQIENLIKAGIDQISIITGYLSEQIEAKIKSLKNVKIDIIFNPYYENYNNLHSLWMAKWKMDQSFIAINGDDIFHNEVIEQLIKQKEKIVMLISRKDHYDEDDMKVVLNNDSVIKVSKKINSDNADGESVGIIKYNEEGAKIIKNKLEQMVRDPENNDKFYLQALQDLMDEGVNVNYLEIENEKWAEIDFHPDLELVKNSIDNYLKTKEIQNI